MSMPMETSYICAMGQDPMFLRDYCMKYREDHPESCTGSPSAQTPPPSTADSSGRSKSDRQSSGELEAAGPTERRMNNSGTTATDELK